MNSMEDRGAEERVVWEPHPYKRIDSKEAKMRQALLGELSSVRCEDSREQEIRGPRETSRKSVIVR